jgi:hypothetical protein
MFLLKAQWEVFGLKAPVFSWLVSLGVLLYCISVYVKHLRESKNRQHVLVTAEKRLRSLSGAEPVRPGNGISDRLYRAISLVFDDLPMLHAHWQRISSLVVKRTDGNGEDRYWVSDDIGSLINAPAMTDSQSYTTAPTVVSGIGLLATFLAILVALLDVKLTGNKVQGLDLLVQGLSGKFLSSVVAVACATLLIYAEKSISRPVTLGVESLTLTLARLLPRLVPVQVLSNLENQFAEQMRIFRTFETDVTLGIKEAINETLAPAVRGLTSSVGDLSRVASEAEAGRKESIGETLRSLLQDVGHSIESSLEQAAGRLEVSLGSIGQQRFKEMTELLARTVTSLEQMSSDLAVNQASFSDFVEAAKEMTCEGMADRKAQLVQLNQIMTELMGGLQEKTRESVGSMEKALVGITLDMSDKLMELSRQMSTIVEEASERSAGKTKELLDQADSLNSRSAEHLMELLERHTSELTRVDELRTLLDVTIKGFVGSINRYDEVTEGLRKAADQVSSGLASLSRLAISTRESQELLAGVSLSATGQIESIRDLTRSQREVWDRIDASMIRYEEVFERVEGHAKELLGQIAHHLGGYSDVTERHFSELTSAADSFISTAVGRLSASVDELGEQLDELHGTVATMTSVSRAAG